MGSYQHLSIDNAFKIINNEKSIIFDIRDEESFTQGHLPGAIRFDEKLILRMRNTQQRYSPVLVYCYHGNSSKDFASLLNNFGFTNVYNLDGGYTAWHVVNNADGEHFSIAHQQVRIWAIEQGFDPDDINACVESGMTLLMHTCRMGLAATAVELIESGANITSVNNDGNNALWFACFAENMELVNALIGYGIPVNNQNITGATALIYAASSGKHHVVSRLLKLGADPQLVTQDGFTALDLAATPQVHYLLRKLQTKSA